MNFPMQERLWRKNRMITDSPLGCVGIDLNRNWDYYWDCEYDHDGLVTLVSYCH